MMACQYQHTISAINHIISQHMNLFNAIMRQIPPPLVLSRHDIMSLFDYSGSSSKDAIYSLDSISIRSISCDGSKIIGTFKFSDMNSVDVDYDGTCVCIEYPEYHSLDLIPGLKISFIHNYGNVFYVMDTKTRTVWCIDNINMMHNLSLPISIFDWTDDDLMMLRLAYESNTGEENV